MAGAVALPLEAIVADDASHEDQRPNEQLTPKGARWHAQDPLPKEGLVVCGDFRVLVLGERAVIIRPRTDRALNRFDVNLTGQATEHSLPYHQIQAIQLLRPTKVAASRMMLGIMTGVQGGIGNLVQGVLAQSDRKGVLQLRLVGIQQPAYNQTDWNKAEMNDPYAMIFDKDELPLVEEAVKYLNHRIEEGPWRGSAPIPAAEAAPRANTLADDLRSLHTLVQDGILTEAEFAAKKAQILGISPPN